MGLPGLGHDPGDRGALGRPWGGPRGAVWLQGLSQVPGRRGHCLSAAPQSVEGQRPWDHPGTSERGLGSAGPGRGSRVGPPHWAPSFTPSFLGVSEAEGITCPTPPAPSAEGPRTGPSCIKFCDLCSWLRVHDCSEGSSQGGVHPAEGHLTGVVSVPALPVSQGWFLSVRLRCRFQGWFLSVRLCSTPTLVSGARLGSPLC